MDGGCIGGDQRVELAEAVGHRAPVEADLEFRHLGIDVVDIADVAVVDLLVVVILDLHDLVARRKGPAEALDLALASGVQGGLQRGPRSASRQRSLSLSAGSLGTVERS